MKYIVEVNAKYLVSVEAETVLSAEHAVLEYDGIWGALAFDSDAMKTETFRGVCLGCETISMKELETLSEEYRAANIAKANVLDAHKAADAEVARLEKLLTEAKAARENALRSVFAANKALADVYDKIGFKQN